MSTKDLEKQLDAIYESAIESRNAAPPKAEHSQIALPVRVEPYESPMEGYREVHYAINDADGKPVALHLTKEMARDISTALNDFGGLLCAAPERIYGHYT